MKHLFLVTLLTVSSLSSAGIVAGPAPQIHDTWGFYEQCMNDNLRTVHTTTKEVVKQFDAMCVKAMQNTPSFKSLDFTSQSAVHQRTLKFRAELMEIAK